MKINNNNGIQATNLYKAQTDEKKSTNTVQKSNTDSLSISGQAAKFQDILRSASAPEEVRTERVNQLKEAIARGEYMIDSIKIAQAMLGEDE